MDLKPPLAAIRDEWEHQVKDYDKSPPTLTLKTALISAWEFLLRLVIYSGPNFSLGDTVCDRGGPTADLH